MEISIGALERGVRALAKKIEAMGLRAKVNVSRSGHGGDPLVSGASYVEIEVEATWQDEGGEEQDSYVELKFIANGYGELSGAREIGGMVGWREMRAEGMRRILRQLEADGWKAPETVRPGALQSRS